MDRRAVIGLGLTGLTAAVIPRTAWADTVVQGDGDRDLFLGLDQLLLHVEQHLGEHLLRVLSLRDEIVDVRLEQRSEARKNAHG